MSNQDPIVTFSITHSLPFSQLQRLVAKVEELPYREVAPLIDTIVRQVNPQLQPQVEIPLAGHPSAEVATQEALAEAQPEPETASSGRRRDPRRAHIVEPEAAAD